VTVVLWFVSSFSESLDVRRIIEEVTKRRFDQYPRRLSESAEVIFYELTDWVIEDHGKEQAISIQIYHAERAGGAAMGELVSKVFASLPSSNTSSTTNSSSSPSFSSSCSSSQFSQDSDGSYLAVLGGTCGALSGKFSIGDIAIPSSVYDVIEFPVAREHKYAGFVDLRGRALMEGLFASMRRYRQDALQFQTAASVPSSSSVMPKYSLCVWQTVNRVRKDGKVFSEAHQLLRDASACDRDSHAFYQEAEKRRGLVFLCAKGVSSMHTRTIAPTLHIHTYACTCSGSSLFFCFHG
jgi:hypothetical protein